MQSDSSVINGQHTCRNDYVELFAAQNMKISINENPMKFMCFSPARTSKQKSEKTERKKIPLWIQPERTIEQSPKGRLWENSETCVSVFSNNSLLIQFWFEDTSRRVDRRVPHIPSVFSSSSTILAVKSQLSRTIYSESKKKTLNE